MRVIASPPLQQKLDAMIDEAQKNGCVVERIELTTTEFTALLDIGKLQHRAYTTVGKAVNHPSMNAFPRMALYRGFVVQETRDAR